jgi:hypothetical protein
MKQYQGIPPHRVIVVDEEGRARELAHVVKHSPTGFSWGYAGSGPADLARSILLDVIGPQGACAACDGDGRVRAGGLAEDGSTQYCMECWGEGWLLAPACYQAFKFEVIAPLAMNEGWVLGEQTIVDWLAGRMERGESVLREEART